MLYYKICKSFEENGCLHKIFIAAYLVFAGDFRCLRGRGGGVLFAHRNKVNLFVAKGTTCLPSVGTRLPFGSPEHILLFMYSRTLLVSLPPSHQALPNNQCSNLTIPTITPTSPHFQLFFNHSLKSSVNNNGPYKAGRAQMRSV